jgi:hypothetical protein
MKLIILIIVLSFLSACGDPNACDGVDTSQAPDQIIRGSVSDTYIWGSCQKTYPK